MFAVQYRLVGDKRFSLSVDYPTLKKRVLFVLVVALKEFVLKSKGSRKTVFAQIPSNQ